MASLSTVGRLSRRTALTGLGTTLLLSTTRTSTAQAKPFIFLTWGGNFGRGVRTAFSEPFERATGLQVRDVTPFNYGRFVTAMQNNNPEGFDLVWFSDEVEPAQAGELGLLERLDYGKIPNAAQALPSARQAFGCSPYVTVYTAQYRTDRWPTAPASWADFWDVEKFPGPRSLGSWVGGVLEAALMADGVAPNDLYPLDVDRAFRKLDELKPHIRTFHNTSASAQVRQMLYQGDLAMVLTWSTDTISQHLAGRPVNVVWNQGFYFSPSVGIPKGSPHAAAAHRYLNLFFDETALLNFVNAWPTTPSIPTLAERLPADIRARTALGHLDKMVNLSSAFYLKHREELQRRYDAWRVL